MARMRFTAFAPLGAVACAGGAIGLSFPLMSLNLDDWGLDPGAIGLFTLAAALSTVVATPFAPPALARFRVRTVIGVALGVIALSFLCANAVRDIWTWAVCRFAAGVSYSFLFVSAEAWMLQQTPPERRGLMLGIFASTFAGAMALGGGVISFVGHVGAAAFMIGAGFGVAGLLAILAPGPDFIPPEGAAGRPSALLARIQAAPLIMAAPLAMGAIETAKYNLIPIYARRIGLGDEVASWMITASGLGVLLLQPLLGSFGDRLGARRTLAICAALGAVFPVAIAAAGAVPTAALGLVFCYSGVVTGLYTLGLVWMAQRFSGPDLAAGNAAFALCYGIGQLIGPAMAGGAFQVWGPSGFMLALASLSGAYFGAVLIFGRAR